MDFLRNLTNGILSVSQVKDAKVFFMLPVNNRINSIESLARVVYRSGKGSIQRLRPYLALPQNAFDHKLVDYFQHLHDDRLETVHFESSDSGLVRALKKINADIVLPVNGTLGKSFPVPWVGYAYDFQHRYLYGNFSNEECYQREIDYANRLKDPACIIANSKAVKNDIARFYPWHNPDKVFDLPFSPNAPANWFEPFDEDVRQKYGLPVKYFLISNQFWIHKDHPTALKAFRELASSQDDIAFVFTGDMNDYRRPRYIDELRGFVAQNGLSDRVYFLGHIPKREQIEIMKDAVAVVQTTLFEGGPGGGCVYDAVSLGVPVILSDIPVNREVDAENVIFFTAGDALELSHKMRDVLTSKPVRQTNAALLEAGRCRLQALGSRLFEAIEYAKTHHGSTR